MVSPRPSLPEGPLYPQLKSWLLAKSEGSWSARVWLPPAAMFIHAAPPPTCTGEERYTASPRPSAPDPDALYPQVQIVPSVLRAPALEVPTVIIDHVVRVPTCTGDDRATRSARPS